MRQISKSRWRKTSLGFGTGKTAIQTFHVADKFTDKFYIIGFLVGKHFDK